MQTNHTTTAGKSAIRSFMEVIEDGGYLCPSLQFQYDQGFVIPRRDNGFVLTEIEFNELACKLREFYACVSAETIQEENDKVVRGSNNPKPEVFSGRRKRPGFVYLLEGRDGAYKIGKAKSVSGRIADIGTKMHYEPILMHSIKCDDYTPAELALHTKFASKRVNGEWFHLLPEDINYIQSLSGFCGNEWQVAK